MESILRELRAQGCLEDAGGSSIYPPGPSLSAYYAASRYALATNQSEADAHRRGPAEYGQFYYAHTFSRPRGPGRRVITARAILIALPDSVARRLASLDRQVCFVPGPNAAAPGHCPPASVASVAPRVSMGPLFAEELNSARKCRGRSRAFWNALRAFPNALERIIF